MIVQIGDKFDVVGQFDIDGEALLKGLSLAAGLQHDFICAFIQLGLVAVGAGGERFAVDIDVQRGGSGAVRGVSRETEELLVDGHVLQVGGDDQLGLLNIDGVGLGDLYGMAFRIFVDDFNLDGVFALFQKYAAIELADFAAVDIDSSCSYGHGGLLVGDGEFKLAGGNGGTVQDGRGEVDYLSILLVFAGTGGGLSIRVGCGREQRRNVGLLPGGTVLICGLRGLAGLSIISLGRGSCLRRGSYDAGRQQCGFRSRLGRSRGFLGRFCGGLGGGGGFRRGCDLGFGRTKIILLCHDFQRLLFKHVRKIIVALFKGILRHDGFSSGQRKPQSGGECGNEHKRQQLFQKTMLFHKSISSQNTKSWPRKATNENIAFPQSTESCYRRSLPTEKNVRASIQQVF